MPTTKNATESTAYKKKSGFGTRSALYRVQEKQQAATEPKGRLFKKQQILID